MTRQEAGGAWDGMVEVCGDGGGRGEQGRCQRTDIHQSGAAAAAGTTRKPLVGPHSRHKACIIYIESSIIVLI